MTTPPEPKATEPSDAELRAIWTEYAMAGPPMDYDGLARRALYNAGHASRDAEVEALKAERDIALDRLELEQLAHDETRGYRQHAELLLKDEQAERDKLHAAMAWTVGLEPPAYVQLIRDRWFYVEHRFSVGEPGEPCGQSSYVSLHELHDATGPGIAAALVRLHQRCTDGK